jgi:DNA-binding transcriptional MocR family regulator
VLAGNLEVTEHTVASAIHRLIGEGYLTSEKGRGTWVAPRSSWPDDIVWTRENAPRCRCGDEPWYASTDHEGGRWRPECVKHDAEALKEGRQRRDLTEVPATAVWEDFRTGAKGPGR